MALVVFIDRHACAKWLPIFSLPAQDMRMAGTHVADATSIFKSRGGLCATRWLMSELLVRQKWMEQREYVETDPSPNGFAREPGWKYQKPLRKPNKSKQPKRPKQKQLKPLGKPSNKTKHNFWTFVAEEGHRFKNRFCPQWFLMVLALTSLVVLFGFPNGFWYYQIYTWFTLQGRSWMRSLFNM